MGKEDTTKRTPSKTTAQEMVLRADRGLDVTWRLFWLLTALSHYSGFSFISESEMARQLKTTIWQIQNSLKSILATGFFDPVQPKGIHRPMQYHRVLLHPDEKPDEFVRRAQACPGIDVCVGLHWIAIDGAKDTGIAQFSSSGIWPVTNEALRLARRKMDRLAYFKIKTGKPLKYVRIDAKFAEQQDAVKPVEKTKTGQKVRRVEKEPISAVAMEEQADRIREAKLEHQQRLAWEQGVDLEGNDLPGLTAKRIQKPMRSIQNPKNERLQFDVDGTKVEVEKDE